ncbi:MAG TPA: cation-transporting P-type ATPase, partial [Myxococcota bacterium]|nr:cation-transporting P-type ATPase [Myxococcota bacterium]
MPGYMERTVVVMEEPFWSVPVSELWKSVGGAAEGLGEEEAARRLHTSADSRLRDQGSMRVLRLLIGQFSSPLVLMLLVAAGISLAVGSLEDAFIILGIVLLSGVLGFYQEHQATRAVERLLKTVQVRPSVRRGGRVVQVPTDEVVVGDILVLSAGALVAADARVLSSRDLHVDEAALTGESFPVEKQEGEVRADAPPSERRSALFMGTHV